MSWFAWKWIILGTVIAGVTIGSVIASNVDSGSGTSGCETVADSLTPEFLKPDENTSQDGSGDGSTDDGSDAGNGSDNGDGGTDGGSDGGTDGGSDGGTDGGSDGGTDGGGNANANDNGNSGGNANANANANANENTNGSAGNTNSGGGNDNNLLIGVFDGTVRLETTQSLSGNPAGAPRITNAPLRLEFDGTGRPVGVLVYGFTDASDEVVDVSEVGDRATIAHDPPQGSTQSPATTTVRVTEATYTSNSMHLKLRLTYSGRVGNLTQTGTGEQTIDVTVEGDRLAYDVVVTYDVTQSSGSINLETGEEILGAANLVRP